jgi:hypothetical protein
MIMRKQTTEPSAATAALTNLYAKSDEWRAQLREAINAIVALEQSGVEAIDPSVGGGFNPDEAAALKLNGHAYVAAPTSKNSGVELFQLRREAEVLRKTLSLAASQAAEAQIDVGRELLAKHDGEIRALHKRRCTALLEVFASTAALERLRVRLLEAGSSVSHPLDGFSLRLGGELTPPTSANSWQRRYLSACREAGIIDDKDLEL